MGAGLASPRRRPIGATGGLRIGLALQGAINRLARDAEFLSDLGGALAGRPQRLHLVDRDRGLAALVNASGLGLGDTFELAFLAQIGLEFGEYAEHVEEALAGSRRG